MKEIRSRKSLLMITLLSISVCIAHALVLHTEFNNYAFTSAVKIVLFLLCPFIYFRLSKAGEFKTTISLKGDKKNTKLSLFLGIFVFAFILVAFVTIFRPLLEQTMITSALSEVGITRNNYMIAFFYVILINAALEEVFFRGFIFLELYRMNFKVYAYIFSAVLFALYHVSVLRDGGTPGLLLLGIIGLVFAGLIFNELARRCDSIVGSLIVHASANLAINLIGVYYMYIY
jgi:membrane protease YdiL (CAAX protease family)